MAYKPTGRPVGRPKTKEYQTISLKIPDDLLDRVKRYAGLHRQSISELIRDGLEWRITEGDPGWQPLPDVRYSGNTVFHECAPPVPLQDDHIPREEDRRPLPIPVATGTADAPFPLSRPAGDALSPSAQVQYNGNTVLPEDISPSAPAEAPAQERGNTVLPTTPPFDTHKYTLGKLCPRGHDHKDTGKSLLRGSNRHCLACDREKFHERKLAKRQAQPA